MLYFPSSPFDDAIFEHTQLCMEAFQRSSQTAVKVAAKVTVTQMLGSSSAVMAGNASSGAVVVVAGDGEACKDAESTVSCCCSKN